MRNLSFFMRGCAGLILLSLIGQSSAQDRGETTEYSDSATHQVVRDDTEQEPIEAEQSATTDDDVWLISTRHLGFLSLNDEPPFLLKISQYSDSGEWVESELKTLVNSKDRKTVVYLHGNRIGRHEAIRRAWNAFNVVQGDPDAPPMRLIIWSWPSDQIHGQFRDFRYKASRTNSEGQYLAWFLSQLDPRTRINLIGYSFGARIATGALHVLGGGTLHGQSTPLADTENCERSPIKVVLIAAALDSHWLAPGGYHERFSSVADRLLVFYNSRDPILQRYRLLMKRARPAALGFRGAWGLDEDLAARTEQYDVSCSVGKTHSESAFLLSRQVVEGVQQLMRLNAKTEIAIGQTPESLAFGR
jgi:pimeloyl-ACP methyl ester carboxylesterase